MDDELSLDDPLRSLVQSLHQDVAVRAGLPQRVVRRERRQRRVRLAGSVLVMAVAVLALEPRLDGKQSVTFALQRPSSHHVALVGDFTDWRTDKLALTPTRNGVWEVTLRLRPGRYRFAYVADDGEWVPDASAAPVVDDFGRPTSVLTVVKQ
ncbi:MAG: isoamylase early set domain-containing protein [Gemmatimonadales bacterium]